MRCVGLSDLVLGAIFEHIQFSISGFTAKEHKCANFIQFCANHLPAFCVQKVYSDIYMKRCIRQLKISLFLMCEKNVIIAQSPMRRILYVITK